MCACHTWLCSPVVHRQSPSSSMFLSQAWLSGRCGQSWKPPSAPSTTVRSSICEPSMNLRVKQFKRQSVLAFVWLLVTQAFVIWMCSNVLQAPYEAYQLAVSLKDRGDVARAHRTMLRAVAEEPHNPGY